MDQLDIMRYVIPKAMVNETQNHLASLRRQRDFEPHETVELGDRSETQPKERIVASQQAETQQNQTQQETFTTAEQEAKNQQALLDNLFRDMPEEVLLAAKNILKGQMKKNEPVRSLRDLKKNVDGLGNLQDPLPCSSVLDEIMDAVRPLDLFDDEDLAA